MLPPFFECSEAMPVFGVRYIRNVIEFMNNQYFGSYHPGDDFVRLACAVPEIHITDVDFNAGRICHFIDKAEAAGVRLLAFPRMCLTGCSCGDLLENERLLSKVESAVKALAEYLEQKSTVVIVSAPYRFQECVKECIFVLHNGKIAKTIRQEECGDSIFMLDGLHFGIVAGKQDRTADHLARRGAEMIVNIDARYAIAGVSPETSLCESERLKAAIIYVSAGFGESTTDGVYSGAAGIYENGICLADNTDIGIEEKFIVSEVDAGYLRSLRRKSGFYSSVQNEVPEVEVLTYDDFRTDEDRDCKWFRTVPQNPFTAYADSNRLFKDALDIQIAALCQRMRHTGMPKLILGISGGLDSTLALLVSVSACDRLGLKRSNVVGVTMPGYGTTVRTKDNARDLMEALGIEMKEISIVNACNGHFSDIEHNPSVHDATYENAQARERTQILMDLANQMNGLVVGTGDLSELALGWATYNGDHMSMYAVNASLPKTFIRPLTRWAAEHKFNETTASGRSIKDILLDIIDTPVSPELLPPDKSGKIAQVTEDIVGPYELHDFFIYHFVVNGFGAGKIFFLATLAFEGKYDRTTIEKWLRVFIRRFFSQQYKRSCMPDGPQVTKVSLSPREGWKMPSDATASMFLAELDE